MQWMAFDSSAAAADALAQAVVADLALAIERAGQAVLAVSGGRSPVPFFQRLAQSPLDWGQVIVTLVDERMVDEQHVDSNARLVREYLLQQRAALARFLPLVRVADNPALCVEQACAGYVQPTVAVLGMGDDGHTASLFPHAVELDAGLNLDTVAPILAVTPPAAPHQRLSMTRAALLNCDKLYLAIQGEAKRTVFERACRAEDPQYPISYFLQQKETPLDVYWAP